MKEQEPSEAAKRIAVITPFSSKSVQNVLDLGFSEQETKAIAVLVARSGTDNLFLVASALERRARMTPEEKTLQQAESKLCKKMQEAEAERASFRDRIDGAIGKRLQYTPQQVIHMVCKTQSTLLDAVYQAFRESWLLANNVPGAEGLWPSSFSECNPIYQAAFRSGVMEAFRFVGLKEEDVRELITNPTAIAVVAKMG